MSLESTREESPGDEDAIRTTVARLSRPHPRGVVIERAAILAAGADSGAIVAWVLDHAGEPESAAAAGPSRGLHGGRGFGGADTASTEPQRYVLPREALAPPRS
jgi:hypothetical protein